MKKHGRDQCTAWFLPISIQAHHSFVDGIHVGKLADKLQQYMNDI